MQCHLYLSRYIYLMLCGFFWVYMTRLLDRLRWKNKHLRLHGPRKYIVVSHIWNNKCKMPEAAFWVRITANKHFCKKPLLIWQIEGHHSKSVMFMHVINCNRWLAKNISLLHSNSALYIATCFMHKIIYQIFSTKSPKVIFTLWDSFWWLANRL